MSGWIWIGKDYRVSTMQWKGFDFNENEWKRSSFTLIHPKGFGFNITPFRCWNGLSFNSGSDCLTFTVAVQAS
jgi:hypothetical protein